MPGLSVADFETLGVYDPDHPHAAQQLELLEFLVSLGATGEDLVVYRDELPGLATVVTLRSGAQLTVAEAAERAGISTEKLLQINRAVGFPQPGPDDRAIGEQLVGLASGIAATEAVFGEDAVLGLARVMGAAMARLADAIVSAFLVNVEAGVRDEDPVGLGIARANAEASALLPVVTGGLEILLRAHILGARRTILGDAAEAGYETQRMSVGFVDLVGSTALAQRLSTRELGSVLTVFEHAAADSVTAAGGRVFGPVVNLAARAVKLAGPGEVVAPPALAATAGVKTQPLGPHQLKGFDQDIELYRLMPTDHHP